MQKICPTSWKIGFGGKKTLMWSKTLRYIYHAAVIVEHVFVQKLAILDTQIQMCVSQWVFIPSQASKYNMLENKCEILKNIKKFEVGQLHFDFRKYAIYIFYIYALREYSK